MPKRSRPPAEKKRLSYERDGRNTYGQHSKASRKAIPAFKAESNRALRHAVRQSLAPIVTSSELELERAEAHISDETYIGLHPVKQKAADEPLGIVLASKKKLPRKKALTKRTKAFGKTAGGRAWHTAKD